jgi:predicted NBD/HSP70 family sugar kinase
MPSTITYAINHLGEAGLVREIGKASSVASAGGGRHPILIDIRTDAALALAICLEETAVSVGLVNLKGELELADAVAVAQGITPAEAVSLAGQLAQRVTAQLDRGRLIGAGVAAPGLVNPITGMNEYASYHGWHDVPLAALLGAAVGLPVSIQNRSRAVALGEQWYGAGRGVDDLIAIVASHVIGAGIIVGGRIHHGRAGRAGEIGHTVVVENGPRCTCGKYGCLEAVSSIRALASIARLVLGAELPGAGAATDTAVVAHVLAAATAGQPVARGIVDNALHHLGLAVANLTVVLDPELVILSGGLFATDDLGRSAIASAIDAVSLAPRERRPKVTLGMLGHAASLTGAATLVFERLLDSGNLLAVGREVPGPTSAVRR